MPLSIPTNEYEIFQLHDGTYRVEISSLEQLPEAADGFATLQEAEAWVFQRRMIASTTTGLPGHL